jgi:hypothetical protein
MMRHFRRAQASGNPRKALQTGLGHLELRGLISADERRSLSRMCDFALIASAGGQRAVAAVDGLRKLHDGLVLKASSPIAVSISSAIVQHFKSNERGVTPVPRRGQNPAAGLLGAVIVGGVIGGLAGGVPGALIGVVGGAIGALTDCSGSDD